MHALRDSSVRRLTAVIAGLALYLQLAFAGLGMLAASQPSDSVAALAEHALCRAAQSEHSQRPSDHSPATPAHDHALFCCLWHPLPVVAAQAVAAAIPVAYALVELADGNRSALVPGPHRSPANARAPPLLA